MVPMAKLPSGGASLLSNRWVIQPPELRVRLRFYFQFQVSNSGLQTASKSYYCNSVYDVDPSLGSNTVPFLLSFPDCIIHGVSKGRRSIWI